MMDRARPRLAVLTLLTTLLFASAASAQSQTPAHTVPNGTEAHGIVGVSVGQRTFTDTDRPGGFDTDEGAYWSQTYGIGATFRRDYLVVSGSLAVQQWIPEARTEAENNLQAHDLMFTTRYAGLRLPDTAFEISPAVSIAVPTSQDSLDSNLLFGAELGLDGRWYASTHFELNFSAALRENSHANPDEAAQLLQPSMYPPPNGLGTLDVSAVIRPTNRYAGPSMMMPSMLHRTTPDITRVFSQGISADVMIIEQLHARVGYGLYQFVGYRSQEDGADPEDGALSVAMQAATVDVVYQPADWVSIGASTATFQGLTPPDSARFRFPLWSVDEAENNQSKIRLYGIFYL